MNEVEVEVFWGIFILFIAFWQRSKAWLEFQKAAKNDDRVFCVMVMINSRKKEKEKKTTTKEELNDLPLANVGQLQGVFARGSCPLYRILYLIHSYMCVCVCECMYSFTGINLFPAFVSDNQLK